MLLAVALVDKVGNSGGIVDGHFTMAIDGGVYEELDASLDGRIDEGFALAELAAGVHVQSP